MIDYEARGSNTKLPWRRVLYERQPYPDNYTDASFLSLMRTNANAVPLQYWPLLRGSSVVSLQVSLVASLLVLHHFLTLGRVSVQSILLFDALTLFLGAVAVSLLRRMHHRQREVQEQQKEQLETQHGTQQQEHAQDQPQEQNLLEKEMHQHQQHHLQEEEEEQQQELKHHKQKQQAPRPSGPLPGPSGTASEGFRRLSMRTNDEGSIHREATIPPQSLTASDPSHPQLLLHCLLFPLSLFLLSPILRTLASSIASDTIASSSLLLFLLHLSFHDYSYATAITPSFSGNLSLLSSVFASVLLSSRLNSDASAFAFLWLALQLFALLPCLQHHLRRLYPGAHDAAAVVTIVVLLLACSVRSRGLALVLAAAMLLLSVVTPAVLVTMQRYKMEIRGPWDEAKLVVGS